MSICAIENIIQAKHAVTSNVITVPKTLLFFTDNFKNRTKFVKIYYSNQVNVSFDYTCALYLLLLA